VEKWKVRLNQNKFMNKPVLSITARPGENYPEANAFYSPRIKYPEYTFESLAVNDGGVYDQVRELFRQAGLDQEHYGSAAWNPLGQWILPGQKVFVLCNFVQEQRLNQGKDELSAKCSHGSVLRALCDYVLIALKGHGQVTFGNAPLQSTNWERVLHETGAAAVQQFYQERGLPVRAMDLRMEIRPRSTFGYVKSEERREDGQNWVGVDLAEESLLTAFDEDGPKKKPQFRVMDYNHGLTEECQSSGRHRYIISRQFLESDVVISLPKLKTHEKVGITCGLKGFVGIVGRKDCLAHHRFGGPDEGGDEYPGSVAFRLWQSRLHDSLNSMRFNNVFKRIGMVFDRNTTRVLSRLGFIYGGAWSGNDTCWRMALDLARIAHYADREGQMQSSFQRKHLSLIDGIIAGEGKGPLSPTPCTPGVLIFGDNVALTDVAACRLMGFDPARIPLVREAFNPAILHPLAIEAWQGRNVIFNGVPGVIESLRPAMGRSFRPSPGWRDFLLG
jgi:uncharacterized protein (DUF362 family)